MLIAITDTSRNKVDLEKSLIQNLGEKITTLNWRVGIVFIQAGIQGFKRSELLVIKSIQLRLS